MHYFPWAVKYGLIISISSLLLLILIITADFVIGKKRPTVRFYPSTVNPEIEATAAMSDIAAKQLECDADEC